MKRPIIGVCPLFDSEKNSLWMLPGYNDGIENAGGVPLMLPLSRDKKVLAAAFEVCDGLVLTGGQDVDPALYGGRKENCGEICEKRDFAEALLLKLALERDKPVLGICRGIQFLNAALGGTLYGDLKTEHKSSVGHVMTPPYDRAVHKVTIKKGTPLYDIIGAEQISVNSYHHQAVKTLSPKLLEAARSEDGLIEGVFLPGKKFVLAVQWHPEFSFKTDENSRKIFSAFVNAAK